VTTYYSAAIYELFGTFTKRREAPDSHNATVRLAPREAFHDFRLHKPVERLQLAQTEATYS
jgi:hypothetical protein